MKAISFCLGFAAWAALQYVTPPMDPVQVSINAESLERCIGTAGACTNAFLKWPTGSIQRVADCGRACLRDEVSRERLAAQVKDWGSRSYAHRIEWLILPDQKDDWVRASEEYAAQFK